jgi:hypothetical protein
MDEPMESKKWPAFAGIDWGGSHHQLCILDNSGKRLAQLRVTHDVAGLADLDTELARHSAVLPIALERSEGLLVEHLQARGHAVFPVSPRIAARARERYRVAPVKDDRFDAFVLADTLRHEHEHWRSLAVPSSLLAEIKALTRDRDRLQETQQAVEAQLRMILEAYHPAPVRLFSSVDRQITLHFVTDYPTPRWPRGSRPPAWPGFWLAITTPVASPPQCSLSGCARTCCPPRPARWPASRFPRSRSPGCCSC